MGLQQFVIDTKRWRGLAFTRPVGLGAHFVSRAFFLFGWPGSARLSQIVSDPLW